MAHIHDSESILQYCYDTLIASQPRFIPTDDPGERQKQIDQFIGHSAARTFAMKMAEDLHLHEGPTDGVDERTLDQKRQDWFEGK